MVISPPLITTLINSFAQSEGETFANDTDADLAAYVQMYRTRIADRTDEIEEMMRGPIDEVMRDAIARLKEEQEEERERLEQMKDEQKRRTATSKGVSLEC